MLDRLLFVIKGCFHLDTNSIADLLHGRQSLNSQESDVDLLKSDGKKRTGKGRLV